MYLNGEEKMEFEEEIFARRRWDFDLMENYGFRSYGEERRYEERLMNGDFKAIVEVDAFGSIKGTIIDLSLGEEYENWKIPSVRGEFVQKIRDEYRGMLKRIAEKCMRPSFFFSAQANRLAERIVREYGDYPETVFENSPGHGLFRNPENRKWYALVLRIDLTGMTGEKRIGEILNLKIEPEKRESILAKEGIFPAYHMNKMKWVSVVLDGRVDDEFVFDLIAISRRLSSERKNRSKRL